jgi:DIS3-like exonuclease 1
MTYEVKKVWYGRSVICSAYQLFYEAAQDIVDNKKSLKELIALIPELKGVNPTECQEKLEALKWAISQLTKISRVLRERRDEGGALELEGVEVRVQVGEEKAVEDLIPKQPLEVHETVAECMIFANHWVAKKIEQSFPDYALLRRHPLPQQELFNGLIMCAGSKGFTINTRSNKLLAESLDNAVDPWDPDVNRLLRMMATHAMSNALYFSTGSISRDQFYHYGLALDRYTHFTSPIRRYADLVVHRLLMAAVDNASKCPPLGNRELEGLSEHMNNKHKAAQRAQRASVEMFQALFFKVAKDDQKCISEAVICGLRSNGLVVFIPRYGMSCPVYLRDKENQVVQPSDDGEGIHYGPGSLIQRDYEIIVVSASGQMSYRLFDHVKVRISAGTSTSHSPSFRGDLIDCKTRKRDSNHSSVPQKKTDIVKVYVMVY